MKTEKGEKLFILMSLFLWYVPFLSVRFTSENFTGLCFLYGLYILFRAFDKENNSFTPYITAGLLFGVSLFVRVAFMYALLGFILWLIIIKKEKWKYLFVLGIGVIIAVGFNIFLDSLFYGKLTFTLYNLTHIYVHYLGGMEINPWWYYLKQFIGRITPPFSIFLLIAFAIGAYKNRKDPLVWVVIPFILIHFIIRHKELRFLFSVSFLFIYVTVLGIDYLLTKKSYVKWHRYIYFAFVLITAPMLLIRTFTPANISVNYCEYAYNHIKGRNIPLFMENIKFFQAYQPFSPSLFLLQNNNECTYLMANNSFYKNPDVNLVLLKNSAQLNDSLKTHNADTAYYLDKSGEEFTMQLNGYKATEVYCFAPEWLAKFIALYIDDKAATWKIYRLTKA